MIFETIVPHVHHTIKGKTVRWIRDAPTDDDIESVKKAGEADSSFDPLLLRSTLLNDVKEGRAELSCRRLLGPVSAKVLFIHERGTTPSINWRVWANIFLAFGKCKKGGAWRVIFFVSSATRNLPPFGEAPGQKHVNGGYAIPNDPSSIVIYRNEEATRVLVHELLHACGSDNMSNSEPMREVLTESWAEIFLIAVLANGSLKKAKQLWKIQSQWIVNQEFVLRNEYNVNYPSDYAWRYTVGRREVMEKLGLYFPNPSTNPRAAIIESLQFTSPLLL
jgi:hypothetical protein